MRLRRIEYYKARGKSSVFVKKTKNVKKSIFFVDKLNSV